MAYDIVFIKLMLSLAKRLNFKISIFICLLLKKSELWEIVNFKGFVAIIVFTAVYFFFIPIVPFHNVMMAPSFFAVKFGIYSTVEVTLVLLVIYFTVLYFSLIGIKLDRYLMRRKYRK